MGTTPRGVLSKFESLRKAATLSELAPLLGFTPSGLSFILYKTKPETLYTSFEIPKKGGGIRTIRAPNPVLKLLQRRLADLLTLCLRDIEAKHPVRKIVSHGFEEGRSIVTNALAHRKHRYVLNLDIADFFGAINFGRVRGYLIRDRAFQLSPAVATVIAQIACFENSLPQGSPCSPVISNLIGAILDRRLIALAKQYRCTYTRYADDLSFSTRLRQFPRAVAFRRLFHENEWRLGRALKREIRAAGFTVNPFKTRMQIVGSRQTVTGIVVNEKVNIAADYYRLTRSMCHSLFRTGKYRMPSTSESIADLSRLEGRLAHVCYVKSRLDRTDQANREAQFVAPSAPVLLYRRFLLYKYFVANAHPTIITEGKSDIVYLAAAMRSLADKVPTLVTAKNGKVQSDVTFIRHTENNGRMLSLGGGSGGIAKFLNQHPHQMKPFVHVTKAAPAIIVVDNDEGAGGVFKAAKSAYKVTIELTSADGFYRLTDGLYLVKTPAGKSAKGESCIEDLFPAELLSTKLNGKSFDRNDLHDSATTYGKIVFAEKVVRPKASKIDFSGFEPLLQGIAAAILDHKTATAKSTLAKSNINAASATA